MLRLRQIVIDTTHARMSAEFWRELLGLAYRTAHEQPGPGEDDPAGNDWLNLGAPDGDLADMVHAAQRQGRGRPTMNSSAPPSVLLLRADHRRQERP